MPTWQQRTLNSARGTSGDDYGSEEVPWWLGPGGGGGASDDPESDDRRGEQRLGGGDGPGAGEGLSERGSLEKLGGRGPVPEDGPRAPTDDGGNQSNAWWRRFSPIAYLQSGAVADDPETNNPRYRGGYFPNPEDTGSPTGPQSRANMTSRVMGGGNNQR